MHHRLLIIIKVIVTESVIAIPSKRKFSEMDEEVYRNNTKRYHLEYKANFNII